jgi:hypothetical protein
MMMALRRGVVVLMVVGGVAWATSAVAAEGATEKTFARGQRVRMELSAGSYTIRAGRDDRIVVRWNTQSGDADEVHVDLTVRGSGATLVASGPRNHFNVVVELPARTDLTTRLSAGELNIYGMAGSKDIRVWAGDITIDVGRAEDYRTVKASVTAGDLSASAFHVSKGGLFRSFSWRGPGTYELNVHLTAGDLKLRD